MLAQATLQNDPKPQNKNYFSRRLVFTNMILVGVVSLLFVAIFGQSIIAILYAIFGVPVAVQAVLYLTMFMAIFLPLWRHFRALMVRQKMRGLTPKITELKTLGDDYGNGLTIQERLLYFDLLQEAGVLKRAGHTLLSNVADSDFGPFYILGMKAVNESIGFFVTTLNLSHYQQRIEAHNAQVEKINARFNKA